MHVGQPTGFEVEVLKVPLPEAIFSNRGQHLPSNFILKMLRYNLHNIGLGNVLFRNTKHLLAGIVQKDHRTVGCCQIYEFPTVPDHGCQSA